MTNLHPQQVSWLVENRVLLVVPPSILTREGVIEINDHLLQYLDTSTTPLVHSIWDDSHIKKFPPLSSQVKDFTFLKHPKQGWNVAFGINKLSALAANVVSQTFRARLRLVNNLEEAAAFLHDLDDTLPQVDEMLRLVTVSRI